MKNTKMSEQKKLQKLITNMNMKKYYNPMQEDGDGFCVIFLSKTC